MAVAVMGSSFACCILQVVYNDYTYYFSKLSFGRFNDCHMKSLFCCIASYSHIS